jgi:branched-chain amino acid transport system substrate-binding protein
LSQVDRRQALKLLAGLGAAGVAAPALAACGSKSTANQALSDAGPIKIGVVVPQTGGYKTIGDDLTNGFQLYLRLTGGRLSGRRADLVFADEGETAEAGKAAVDKLLTKDRVSVLTGVVNSAVMLAVKDEVEAAQIPLIGSNASPTNMQGVKYIWRTSFVNDEPGRALGKYVADRVGDGSVFLIAADYSAGHDEVAGFKDAFISAGKGRIAGEVYTPFLPTPTTKFDSYLDQVKDAKPRAVFCFYAGASAVAFVKQYKESGLGPEVELYSGGFLTEGTVLRQQGDAAKGVYTSMNYSVDLDNPANRRFVSEYQKAYGNVPTTYAMASYDAAAVLDKAVALAAGDVSPVVLNASIGKVGTIDSPRGPWQFNQSRTPLQKWWLRQVRLDGTVLTNTVISELVTLG